MLAHRAPLHVGDIDMGQAGGQQAGKQVQRLVGPEVGGAHAGGQRVTDGLLARKIADIGDGAPADGKAGQAFGAPGRNKGFHAGIRGDVVGLARIADCGGNGGVDQEGLDRVGTGQAVEGDGATQLRGEHAVEPLGR